MKKIITVILAVILCCAPLCACSTDFSEEINEGMDGLYETLYNALELFFKQPGVDSDSDSDAENNEKEPNEGEEPNEGGSGDNGGNNNGGDVGGENEDNNGGSEGGDVIPEQKYEIGTQVGQKLPSYSVQIFDENGVSDEYIDPSALGKVTVINFWGTWCPPCVNELPEFSEVASEYKENVTIVAIHSVQNFTTNAVSHIQNNFSDSEIIFARDVDLGEGISYYDECYEAFGGNGYYPYTIILDENGVITYAKEGALSEFQLKVQLELALGN